MYSALLLEQMYNTSKIEKAIELILPSSSYRSCEYIFLQLLQVQVELLPAMIHNL